MSHELRRHINADSTRTKSRSDVWAVNISVSKNDEIETVNYGHEHYMSHFTTW